ncbi:MAG: hypothetical protein IJA23_05765 [Clostridia bacterium]|nr:hypothetical protein [Clostridia bacterium]
MSQKVFVSWEDINKYLDGVVEDVKKRGLKPSGVYGVPRGGLIFATMLSYKMDIPLLLNAAKDCIIIDDIADSGRTLMHFTKNDTQFHKFYITTMYYHERSVVKPDYYMFEKKDNWIVYPYEFDN